MKRPFAGILHACLLGAAAVLLNNPPPVAAAEAPPNRQSGSRVAAYRTEDARLEKRWISRATVSR